MVASSVTIQSPPADAAWPSTLVRPTIHVEWEGGTGPFNVEYTWDDDPTFANGNGNRQTSTNTGVTSPDSEPTPADLGDLTSGTVWYLRANVIDTGDASAAVAASVQVTLFDPIEPDRFLHLLSNCTAAFDPIDTPAGGWGPDPDLPEADGAAIDFNRFLYLLASNGAGFDPTDTPGIGWDPEAAGAGAPGDGLTRDLDRFLYLLAGDVTSATPTPHIWYVFPAFGREGWEFRIVGYGFGDTQGTYSGSVTLNGLAVGVISWELVAQTSADLTIDQVTNTAEPIHQLIRASVPDEAQSGLVIVCHDGP